MRTLKKSLALVLVVAMTVSLLSVGAFASSSSFTDASSVGATYAEAVDLLSGIGIVNGTTSTTLEPTGNYTREQAAKVVCYMALGKTAADALVTGSAPFTDVAADRWSAGFIAYCVSQGIIAGNGDGTFNPTGALTGYAWAKMLVTALGYNKAGEFTGASWEIAVAKSALTLGVFKNDTTAATNKTITRQQAMLLAYNTLFLSTVEAQMGRDNGTVYVTSYTTGKASLASTVYGYGATSGKAYTDAKSAAANDVLVKYAATVNGTLGYYWYYNNTTTPISAFYSAETVIGSSTNGKSLATLDTYSTTNSYYIADVASTTTYYINGAQLYNSALTSDTVAQTGVTYYSDAAMTTALTVTVGTTAVTGDYVASAGAAKIAAAAAIGYGVKVAFVSTDAAGDTTVAEKVYITTYYTDVVKAAPVVKTNTVDGKSYIYLDMTTTDIGSASAYTVLASKVTGYTGLVAGDVVTVTANTDGSYILTKAATFTGSATASTSTSLTVGGTTYYKASGASSKITSYTEGFLNSVAFYTDAYGYLVYAAAVTSATTNYAYIIKDGSYVLDPTSGTTNVSYVALKDGSTATITVANVNGTDWDGTAANKPIEGSVYSYSKNTDGTYALTIASTLAYSTVGTSGVSDNNGTITQGVSSATGTVGFKGDSGTVYVLRDINVAATATKAHPASGTALKGITYYSDAACTTVATVVVGTTDVTGLYTIFAETGTTYDTTWKVYTGYTNMITATGAVYAAAIGSDGYADTVFVSRYATTATTASSVIYLLDTTPTAVYKAANTIDYYTYPAIVDGVQTVVKAASGTTLATLNIYNAAFPLTTATLCKVVYTDGKLAAGSITPINATTAAGSAGAFKYATGIAAPANGVVTIGYTGVSGSGTDYAYTSSTYVFYISKDHSTVTMGLVDSISTDTTVIVSAVSDAAAVIKAGGTPTAAQQNSLYAIFIQATV